MFDMFLVHKNKVFSQIITLQCVRNDDVVNFIDVINSVHCAGTACCHSNQKILCVIVGGYNDARLERLRFKKK